MHVCIYIYIYVGTHVLHLVDGWPVEATPLALAGDEELFANAIYTYTYIYIYVYTHIYTYI